MRYIVLFTVFILSVIRLEAQEAWPIVQNCMGDLTYPVVSKGNWDFDGVIIISVYPDGVRAIRADNNVDYYLALESAHSFPGAGAVSPDGQYFAYPVGHTVFNVNTTFSDIMHVDNVRVVRTDGDTSETYLFDIGLNFAYTGMYRSPGLPQVIWLGSDWVYYEDLSRRTTGQSIFNFKSRETSTWTLDISPARSAFVSPDGKRWFNASRSKEPTTLYDLENGNNLEYPAPRFAAWFPDSSAFIASDEDGISIVDRNGNLIETIRPETPTQIAVAPNGKAFAYWYAPPSDFFRNSIDEGLYIADMENRVIYDLCFQATYKPISSQFINLAWSPDSRSLAFGVSSRLVILDTQTFTNRVVDSYAKDVMAWGPLEGEPIESTGDGIHLPQATPTLIPTATLSPTLPPPTSTPDVATCQLEVVAGANLRSGAGTGYDKVGSADVGFMLTADAQQFNSDEYFRWWRLTTGEWIREDFVKEEAGCDFLPDLATP